MALIIEVLARLLSWRNAIRDAEMDADRYLRSAKFAANEIRRKLDSQQGAEMFISAASSVGDISDPDEISALATTLSCIPLPLPLFDRTGPRMPLRPAVPPEAKADRIAVAFSSFELDGKPFADPHNIQPGVIHDLTNLSRWPPAAEKLTFTPLSIEPSESYEFPTFEFERPQTNAPFELAKTARMVVKLRTSVFARPLEFNYGARFLPEKEEFTVSVQGQYRLKVRSDDPARHSQTGYVEVDKRLVEIRDEARLLPAITDSELSEFLELLSCVGAVAGRSLQDNLFRKKYSESEFQAEFKGLLRTYPEIGSTLEEHPHAARGITDLSFKRFRIELKVDSEGPISIGDVSGFLQQTAQYVAGSDRRFGLLCLLDCSEKTQAPGGVGNDIALAQVPAPNGSLPICIGVVIIRGNLARPSSFS